MGSDFRSKLLKWVVVLIPAMLIMVVYLQNRSLFLDSLNLARNIGERSFIGLLDPLSYEQSAPVLFLWGSELLTELFGINEYILRLLPLLAGLGSLYYFSKVSSRFLSSPLCYVAVLWLGSHELFVRYATEYKQYISDVFAVVFLLWIALENNKVTKRNITKLSIVGLLMMWLSMPSVFVLGAMILWFAYNAKREGAPMSPLLGLIFIYALSFGVEYYFVLSPVMQTSHMQNFHDDFFLDGKFWQFDSLTHDIGLIVSEVKLLVGKSGLAIGAGFISIIICLYTSIKARKYEFLLLILPIMAAFFASMIGKYSILERLMLFSLPLLILLVLIGVQSTWVRYKSTHNSWGVLLGVLTIGLSVGFIHRQGLHHLVDPLEIEDNKSCLEYIASGTEFDLEIICTDLAFPAYDYYVHYDNTYKSQLPLMKGIMTHYNTDVIGLAKIRAMKNGGVWVLAGHKSEAEIDKLVEELDAQGTIKNSYRANHSIAILFTP